MITDDTRTALANEARLKGLQVKIAKIQGAGESISVLAQLLSTQSSDTQTRLTAAQAELNAVVAGAGPGITDDFGVRSIVDNAATAERVAGQIAVVTAIKGNHTLTKSQAETIWGLAALASRPSDRQWLLMSTESLVSEYIANALEQHLITEATWEALRTYIIITPVEELV